MYLLPMNRIYDELFKVRLFTAQQIPPYIKFLHVLPEPGATRIIRKLITGVE
ncbi:hypothetical protein I6N95_26580 [Vagococcus sp. BWB3-3]|uniref:Uncharacterized protein n=1 Tax=Vagococcus allomyrinae TaxID=2794353 RepID=A0A940PEJ5_9ENTE|nr:hypothetical protein [Vagococcus allomyrinae]MBP1044581.1 hypothetical protein [Vagococcus allomyrinae]